MAICKNCGGGELDEDPSRGDAVCMKCGAVVENNIIVSRVEFKKDSGGGGSGGQVIGQFVSLDSKAGAMTLGPGFRSASAVESRDITIRAARSRATVLCNKLRLGQRCLDMAVNFFKMALVRGMTRGRVPIMVTGACVYLSARLEGSALTLVDFCDAMDTADIYRLGRTFSALTSALCIHPPVADPTLYVLRFATSLDLGTKTQAVVLSAMRLVQRMKRDSIHSGRRPSGLCGAALLVAARLHGYNRSVGDIIKVVRVHHSTLRKRLMEFGDTPSSFLSLDEFMTVDLEDEQDPPSYCAARRKDPLAEKLESEDTVNHVAALKVEIEKELEKCRSINGSVKNILWSSAMGVVESFSQEVYESESDQTVKCGLPPTLQSLGCEPKRTHEEYDDNPPVDEDDEEVNDSDVDEYILNDEEAEVKRRTWYALNEDYLKKEEERKKKLEEEGQKPRKKKKNVNRKMAKGNWAENMEKIIQERKKSTKINYDVLKELDISFPTITNTDEDHQSVKDSKRAKIVDECTSTKIDIIPPKKMETKEEEQDVSEDEEAYEDTVEETVEESVGELLRLHTQDNNDDDLPNYFKSHYEEDYN